MSDAADILGVQKQKSNESDPLSLLANEKTSASSTKEKMKKPKGMSREVFNLMGKDGIAPSIQTNTEPSKPAFKNKRQNVGHGKWVWAAYQSSARSDSQPFYHWVRADLQTFDYIYAKFNTKLDPVTYSNDEYETHFKSKSWTRSETDQLMNVCHEYNMRWPVIADRFEATAHRSTEDLMARYYFIASTMKTLRNDKRGSAFTNKSLPSCSFDVDFERCRRKQQDRLYHMTPEEQEEEAQLREELKTLESSIKKIKKSIKQAPHPPAQSSGSKNASSSSSKKKSSQKDSQVAPATTASIAAANVGGGVGAGTLLKPMPPIVMYGGIMSPAPGQPCLQSARLSFTNDIPDFTKKVVSGFEGTSSLDLSEPFIVKIKHFSQEIGVPNKLLPTRAVCDLNDQIHRDIAILLSLRGKIAANEEKIEEIREKNPNINAAAFGSGLTEGSSCRLSVPETTFVLKDSDTSGHALSVTKPYAPAPPFSLVPPPPAPPEKAGDKDKSSLGSKSKSDSTKAPKKPSKAKRKAADISKDSAAVSSTGSASAGTTGPGTTATATVSSTATTSSVVAPATSQPAPSPTVPATTAPSTTTVTSSSAPNNKQTSAAESSKGKSKATGKPTIKRVNPVLAKAATIPIPPLNNTPQSIAIANAANAIKAKIAAEQKAAEAMGSQSSSAVSSAASKHPLQDTSQAISAAVKAVASSVSTAATTVSTSSSTAVSSTLPQPSASVTKPGESSGQSNSTSEQPTGPVKSDSSTAPQNERNESSEGEPSLKKLKTT